jgi:colanic acid/amylovoran biosynthesis glycosyltransferase
LLQIIRRKEVAGFQALRFDIYRRNLRDLSALFQASELSARAPYDIVHCQFATLSEYALKHRRAGLLDGAIVVHFRGYDITEVVQSHGPGIYDYVWAAADHFIANCEAFKDRAIGMGCSPDRISVVGTGIDLSFFPYRPPILLTDNKPIRIAMVGRLIERKGFHVALTALSQLQETYNYDFEIAIIGDGPDRARLSQLAMDLGLEGMVNFMGRQPHETVRQVLSSSHLFMAPSMTSAAGGEDAAVNTLKEAMALGVPVVATRHGGIPELVVDGQTGWLADENDSADLSRAVADMIDKAATWQKTAEQARAIVEEKFDLQKMTSLQEDVYRHAIRHRDNSKKLIRTKRRALFKSEEVRDE